MRCIWVREWLRMWCSLCASIEFCGIVVQIEMRENESLVFADGALADQFSECAGESGATGVGGEPEAFFRAECVIERKSIGAEHHFVRVESEELFENALEL